MLMVVLMATFGVWWFFYALHLPLEKQLGRPEGSLKATHLAFIGPKLADNAQWRDECGSCHLAFHPSLLPSRSWVRIMDGQDKHFGADLALDAPTRATLLAFLSENSAERRLTEPATKIALSLKSDAVPLRITETPYWIKKHRDIAASYWSSAQVKSRSNCAACHLDAEAGTFQDAAMRLPKLGA
jgi:hypothetical protein